MYKENTTYNSIINKILLLKTKNYKPLAFVKTYGCQQNASDGEKIKGMLKMMGYSFTDKKEEADLILFNTCAVREHAENRIFGNVGALKNLKKKNPQLIIALCGCMMEQEHIVNKIKTSFGFVDLIFSTNSLQKLPELMYNVLINGKSISFLKDEDFIIDEDTPIHREEGLKTLVPVMYGCNNFCSYCVVPHVRGRERSREPNKILEEIKSLVSLGYKEITLLGQNVNSYNGVDADTGIKKSFSKLLSGIDALEGEFWVRFITSHPKDLTEDLINTMANSKHICKNLHLPFQSGSNRILKLMNRKYDREKYLSIVNLLRKKIPDITLTSDVIVGFPGETYDEFKETLSLIKEVGFISLYTFIYSKRTNTPAAKMNDPIPRDEKVRWFSELLSVQDMITKQKYTSMLGKEEKVLIEKKSSLDDVFTGRTSGNMLLEFKSDEHKIGDFTKVKITGANNCVLKGSC